MYGWGTDKVQIECGWGSLKVKSEELKVKSGASISEQWTAYSEQ